MVQPLVLAVAVSLSAPAACAFSIEHSEARYVDKHFHYELIVTLDAPIDRVEQVLRDYDAYPSLNSRILSAKVLGRPAPAIVELQTTMELCLGWFCRDVTRVEHVHESKYVLLAIADPERSDVKFSETRSELTPANRDATRVKYVTNVVPDFWVPALGGRRMLLKVLETESRDLFMSVEAKAKLRSAAKQP
jgi:uncharacterized membrane protein